jgi:hypothetical protein
MEIKVKIEMTLVITYPAQDTRLISFTPPENNPGELHWIMKLGIEIASYLGNHNSLELQVIFIKANISISSRLIFFEQFSLLLSPTPISMQ